MKNSLNKRILFENEFCTIFQVTDYRQNIWFRKDKITNKKMIVSSYFDENEKLIKQTKQQNNMDTTLAEFEQKQISKCRFIIEKANAEIENIEIQIDQLKKQLKEQKRLIKEAHAEIKWRSM